MAGKNPPTGGSSVTPPPVNSIELSVPCVQIPVKEYQRLLESDAILDALYAAGVDNWEFYDIAMETRDND